MSVVAQNPEAGTPRRQKGTLRKLLFALASIVGVIILAWGLYVVLTPTGWVYPNERRAQTELKTLSAAIDTYRSDHGAGCPTIEDLANEKIIKRQYTFDPWKHPYQIIPVGNDCSVYSLGPDGNPGTDDDLCEPTGACGVVK